MRFSGNETEIESLDGADLLDHVRAVIARNARTVARTRALVARTHALLSGPPRSDALSPGAHGGF